MIYADDTTLYSSLGKSGLFATVESAGELELDLHSIVEWGDRKLVIFNATKTNHHRDPLLVPAVMNGIELGLTFTRSMDWKSYIQSIAKAASRKVGSLYSVQHSLLLNPYCICTNLPFGHVWSTVSIFGVVLQDPKGLICLIECING